MNEAESRRMKRLEDALRTAYCGVDDLLTDIHPKPGINGQVQWARTKQVRDELRAALHDTSPDESGTIPIVM